MRTLRLLFCINRLNPGGAERQLLTIARHLPRPECHVTIATLYDDNHWQARAEQVADAFVTCGRSGRLGLVPALRRLQRFIADGRFDVIHPFAWPLHVFIPFLARGRAGQVLSSILTSDYHWPAPLHCVMPRLEIAAMQRADLVVANSIAGKQWAVRRGLPENKIIIIVNPIDPQEFPPTMAAAETRRQLGLDGHFLVLAVARLDEVKGLAYLIRAAALARTPKLQVIIAGDGTLRRPLEALARRLAAPVRFLGSRDDLGNLYRAADLTVLPSIHGEGFPNAIAESLILGTPVITTPMGDSAVLVTDRVSGRIIPPRDAPALAAAIDDAAANPGARQAWGAAGRETVSRLCAPASVAAQHLALYRQAPHRN